MYIKEINSYDHHHQVYVNDKTNGTNMNYRIDLYIDNSLIIRMRGASYKTSRQREFRHISITDYRGTREEKREHYFKQIETLIPTCVINFAMEELLKAINFKPWEGKQ